MFHKKYLNKKELKSIFSESWAVGWPMTLIMFLVFLIGLADVFVAGKFGKEVQAAYGVVFQLYFIFSIIAAAISVGSVSMIARLFTSSKKEDFLTAVDSSLILTIVSGIVLSLIGVFFSKHIIYFLGIPAELKYYAVSLIKVYSFGLIFNYLLLNTNAILRASKMIRLSLATMILVCVLNIALNFIFAFKTSLGFVGIAWATLVSTFFGSLINFLKIKKEISGSFRFSFNLAKKIINIGWPAGLLQVFWQLGAMVLFLILSVLPENNIEIMAAFTNGLKIESVIFLAAFAFNMANAVVIGNLLGKKEVENSFSAGLVTAFIGVILVSTITLLVMFNARIIASFLSDNPVVIDECVKYIYISLIFEPIMAWGVILGGGLNGAGDTKSVMLIIALSVWMVRVPLAYILGIYSGFGAIGVWWAMNASVIVQSIFISKRYFSKHWIKYSEKTVAL